MGEVIGEVLPLAIGIAVSPFPIIPVILLLFTGRPRANSGGFLAGWAVGILAATAVFAALAAVLETRDYPPVWASWARIGFGLLLLFVGGQQWLERGQSDEPPAWMRTIEDSTPGTAARLGALLSAANPKILLLAAAAGLGIGAAELDRSGTVAAIVLFTIVAASTVALPIVLFLIVGEPMLTPLASLRDWLQTNNAVVMAVVITVIGAVLIVKGVSGL